MLDRKSRTCNAHRLDLISEREFCEAILARVIAVKEEENMR
jgi:hypothetical protein